MTHGRQNIEVRHDLINSLRMIGGKALADLAKGRTSNEIRQMIEAAFELRAA